MPIPARIVLIALGCAVLLTACDQFDPSAEDFPPAPPMRPVEPMTVTVFVSVAVGSMAVAPFGMVIVCHHP